MIENHIARAFVSLLYCGAMEGQPALLYLWVLAGTPVSISAASLEASAPVLAGSLVPVLGGKLVSWVWAFLWGLAAGSVASQASHQESTEAPSGEANHDPRDC